MSEDYEGFLEYQREVDEHNARADRENAREFRQWKREKRLVEAIQSLIGAWESPGPTGTMMDMPRAISYAKGVLTEQESRT